MKFLKVDDKWSIQYNPEQNDRPEEWLRYGCSQGDFDEKNNVVALFYALLAKEQQNG